VIKAQALLANAGYYDLPDPGMPTGWPGGELNRALTRFQKDHGLEPDGTLLPLGPFGVGETGVGETAQALKLQLFDTLQHHAAPTVAEVDSFYRGRRPGEPEPATDVALRSADGDVSSGEPVGVKPVVMSDERPADYELKPGQEEARANGPWVRPSQPPRLQPARPQILQPSPLAPQQPQSTPPQYGPYPQIPRDRIPAEWLREPSIIQRLQEPNSYAPKHEAPPKQEQAPQRGRIIIAEDGKELHVPPLGTWAKDLTPEDRQIADGLSDAFAIEMAKRPGSRGDEWTQKGIDMYVQGCLEAAREDLPKLAANLEHIAGGTQDGKGVTKLTEEYLANVINDLRARLGSGRSDFTLEFARNVVLRFRANTTSKLADGVTNTTNEQNRLENMDRLTLGNGDYVAEFPKFPKGMSDAEMEKQARKACRDELSKWFEEIVKTGEFESPAPKDKTLYRGHHILKDLKK
jgi:peptidoglycan hydrolase-like protein with peptidoglycan-binding domain